MGVEELQFVKNGWNHLNNFIKIWVKDQMVRP